MLNNIEQLDLSKLEGLEIYDTPTKNHTQNIAQQQEIYDVPANRAAGNPRTTNNYFEYDNPRNTVISKDEVDAGAPKAQSNLDIDKLMGEIYDSPFSVEPSISTIKRSPSNSNRSTPRNSMNHLNQTPGQPGHEIYDIPTQQQLGKGFSDEIYDVPAKRLSKTNSVGTSNIQNYISPAPASDDLPKSEQQRRIVYEETYDIPTSKFGRNYAAGSETSTPASTTNTPSSNKDVFYTPPPTRKNMNHVTREDVYDTPPARQEIYDTPPTRLGTLNVTANQQQEIYDTPPTRQEIYDTPPTRPIYNSPPSTKPINSFMNVQQEIYDTPPTRQEIYDTPPTRQEIYDTPPPRPAVGKPVELPISTSVLADREELYDVPNRSLLQKGKIKDLRGFIDVGGAAREDIYDTPTNHSLLQTMGQSNNSSPGDDYVDYSDVWKDESPVSCSYVVFTFLMMMAINFRTMFSFCRMLLIFISCLLL